jgi:hypothetical protein
LTNKETPENAPGKVRGAYSSKPVANEGE